MNDEIVIYVVGGSSNRKVAGLPGVLRRAGHHGKITAQKLSPNALKRAQAAVEEARAIDRRTSNTAWR